MRHVEYEMPLGASRRAIEIGRTRREKEKPAQGAKKKPAQGGLEGMSIRQ
jgi:hypothetical protein